MSPQWLSKARRFTTRLRVTHPYDALVADGVSRKRKRLRSLIITGVIGSAMMHTMLPQSVARRLGLEPRKKVTVLYPDGRTAVCDAAFVEVELLGRSGTFTVTIVPRRRYAIIGRMVLDALDLLIDPVHKRLYPRDPRFITREL